MTCEEFKRIVEVPGVKLASELLAVARHVKGCESCSAWVHSEVASFTPERARRAKIVAADIRQFVKDHLANDPEAVK